MSRKQIGNWGWLGVWGFFAFAIVGCGNSEAPPAANQTAPAAAASTEKTADEIVLEFMASVKAGNKAKADELITPLAKQKIAEAKLSIDPPGSATMTYSVKAVQFIETPKGTLAHVACEYVDKNEDGVVEKQEILWALRATDAGWRIAGMALKIFDDAEAVLMDFENPDDMLQKQRLIAEEIQRRIAVANAPPGTKPLTSAPPAATLPDTTTPPLGEVRQATQVPKNGTINK